MPRRRPRLHVLIKGIQKELSSLKKAGGRDLAKGNAKRAVKKLAKHIQALDDTADGCGYTLIGD